MESKVKLYYCLQSMRIFNWNQKNEVEPYYIASEKRHWCRSQLARGHAAHTHGIAKVSEWARLLRRLLDAAADDCGVDYTLN